MELKTEWISHRRDGQEMKAYQVLGPQPEHSPAILVIQEIWGPDEHIQDLTERVAAAGYVALAPDLYSRGGRPDVISAARVAEMKEFMDTVPQGGWHDRSVLEAHLAKETPDKAQRVQETLATMFGPRDMEGMAKDLVAWVDYLAAAPESRGRSLGSTGYCMGGALSFRLATMEPRLKVALVYYGSAPEESQLAEVKCPVYGFYGSEDERITGAVSGLEVAMQAVGKSFEAKVYQGAGHAFFNDSRASYNVDAARDAWARTLGLFNQYLN
jgi:carboxymethylenebutenolidase